MTIGPIPRHELTRLLMTQGKAEGLADKGSAADGYTALQEGLARAIELREAGEPWGVALVKRWQESVDRFAETHKQGPDIQASREEAASKRILEEARLLGSFAWRSYQESGRGLILLKLNDLDAPNLDLEEGLEYFTVAQLANLGD